MTRTDYLRLRRIHRATRDPELGRVLLEYELRRRPRSPAEVTQLSIRVVEVYCEPMAARITVAECIRRASATTASGRGKGYPIHEACKPCPLREIHRAMSPWTPPPFRAFNVNREAKQRRAKWKAIQSGAFGPVSTIDTPAGEE
jgi:hypothetical protein